jgi:tRNA uracil 4-sulfurtransferase
MGSSQLGRTIGLGLAERFPNLRPNLTDPSLTFELDVQGPKTYVSSTKIKAMGGLPVGTSGRGLCLLSGGIDSPVAAHMMMQRGLTVACISFYSPPFLGEGSLRKIQGIVRHLAR